MVKLVEFSEDKYEEDLGFNVIETYVHITRNDPFHSKIHPNGNYEHQTRTTIKDNNEPMVDKVVQHVPDIPKDQKNY